MVSTNRSLHVNKPINKPDIADDFNIFMQVWRKPSGLLTPCGYPCLKVVAKFCEPAGVSDELQFMDEIQTIPITCRLCIPHCSS